MSDDQSPSMPPADPHEKPLEYWQPADSATTPFALTAHVIGGVICGILASIAGCTLFGVIVLSATNGKNFGLLLFFMLLFALGFVGMLIRKLAQGKSLAIDHRRRKARFFMIGFLIGCGLGCLLEGICFSALKNI